VCQKFARSHQEASEDDLQSLRRSSQPTSQRRLETPDRSLLPEPADNLLTVDATATPLDRSDPFKDVPVFSTTSAELYFFDTTSDMFIIQEKDIEVDIASNGEYDSG
jgi:hypothetical protein